MKVPLGIGDNIWNVPFSDVCTSTQACSSSALTEISMTARMFQNSHLVSMGDSLVAKRPIPSGFSCNALTTSEFERLPGIIPNRWNDTSDGADPSGFLATQYMIVGVIVQSSNKFGSVREFAVQIIFDTVDPNLIVVFC